ncbi:hypothetical protein [Clostridium sp. UBA4548]|nr:hypothetical protein [Clostridium sp. UBA4548]
MKDMKDIFSSQASLCGKEAGAIYSWTINRFCGRNITQKGPGYRLIYF